MKHRAADHSDLKSACAQIL